MKETIKILTLVAIVLAIMIFFMMLGTPTAADTKPVDTTKTEEPETAEINALADDTGISVENPVVLVLTDEERKIVEQVVMAEARGESLEGQMAVAQTIRDRCIDRQQTPEQVCTAPNQYATTSIPATERVKDAVMFIFDFGHSVFDEPTFYFYQCEMIDQPSYLAQKTFRGQIGPHRFFG